MYIEDAMEKKEDIKKVIDTSTDYKELCDNSIQVLQKMESRFKRTLYDIGGQENRGEEKSLAIQYSVFDDTLDTDNPVTIFEKKGKELLDKSRGIIDKNRIDFASMKTALKFESRVTIKQKTVDELWSTRMNAIRDFKKDLKDGILSNKNNIDHNKAKEFGEKYGKRLFKYRENHHKEFEQKINNMALPELVYTTSNMYEGSGGYMYCFKKLKEKLSKEKPGGSENLFDYIDSLGGETSKILRYSALSMLLFRSEAEYLKICLNTYKGKNNKGKDEILKYIKNKLGNDEKFKERFLMGLKFLEGKIPEIKKIGDELKQNDPMVKKAAEKSYKFDNVDIFKSRKIKGLFVYDDAGHGGGNAYFSKDYNGYTSKGFTAKKEDNKSYIKYELTKGEDKITMIKLKGCDSIPLDDRYKPDNLAKRFQPIFAPIVGKENYNLFALRGHCYYTNGMAYALGGLKAVKEDDIFIDGGCGNARYTGEYYAKGIKGYMFAYNGEGHGDSTKAFIDNIFNRKSSRKSFSDLMNYYSKLNDKTTNDGYFAAKVERPDTVAYNYKILKEEQLKK